MLKPKRLQAGDKVAIVSLSWGGLGDKAFLHKYKIAKKRLEEEFGLSVIAMPNALKGSEFIAEHPELRAKDLMDAFEDLSVAAVFCEFGEYVKMFDYTKNAVRKLLFEDTKDYIVPSSPEWSDDFVPWDESNQSVEKRMKPELHGYEILQGSGSVQGHLLGGCIDVFTMLLGTSIWPSLEEWRGAILFLETSEEKPSPEFIRWILRNLAAQGILKVLRGVIVGKPQDEVYYEEYKEALIQVVHDEEGLEIPILYNMNIGHAMPSGGLPYGIKAEIDCENKTIKLLESATQPLI